MAGLVLKTSDPALDIMRFPSAFFFFHYLGAAACVAAARAAQTTRLGHSLGLSQHDTAGHSWTGANLSDNPLMWSDVIQAVV